MRQHISYTNAKDSMHSVNTNCESHFNYYLVIMKHEYKKIVSILLLLLQYVFCSAQDITYGALKFSYIYYPGTTYAPSNTLACTGFVDSHKSDKTVTIPSHFTKGGKNYMVTHIGYEAFRGCSSLESVTFDGHMFLEIESAAFRECTSLKSIIIPSEIRTIGDYAFTDCTSLISVDMSKAYRCSEIAKYLFDGCESLSTVMLPPALTTINESAFSGCKSLESIDLPSIIRRIGKDAFGASGLKEIVIPYGVTDISESMFMCCKNLTSVDIPTTVRNIGSYAFYECKKLASINLPESITSIGNDAFRQTGLTSFRIPTGVTKIEDWLLAYCEDLKEVTIPEGVTEIGDISFFGCTKLVTLTIPSSTQYIGKRAIAACQSLKYLICLPTKAPKNDILDDSNYSGCVLLTPQNASGYTGDNWDIFEKPQNVNLTDDTPILEAQGFCAGNLTYTRYNMKAGGYATFCLPFDTDLSEVSDKFDGIFTANQTALYKPDGKLILLLQEIGHNSIIPAGQAFVVKLKQNETSVTFSNNNIMIVNEDSMQNPATTPLHVFDWDGKSGLLTENTDINVSYGGALSTMTGLGNEYETFNSNGTFGPTENGTVKAFRAYVVKGDATTVSKVKSITLGLEDVTTGINVIANPTAADTYKAVYSIDGRLVSTNGSTNGLPNGIYIRNHKKIIVK